MKYDEFTELVKNRLADVCGPEFSVGVYEALKNNSVTHKGLCIREEGSNISPTIYMDEFYTDYCDGRDIEDIVNDILRVYSENRLCPDFETDRFGDPEWVKERFFYKLINARQNIGLLQQVPSHPVMDLAMVYGVYMGEYRGAFSSVMIRNEHMNMWGMSEAEIRERAIENTPKLMPVEICTMGEMLSASSIELEIPEETIPMYVMTNRMRLNGASTMLYGDILPDFARNIGLDLYIIPSSVHELILLPDDGKGDPQMLKDMISEVNDTQVDREEILSYSLYRYSIDSGKIDMAVAGSGRAFSADIGITPKKVASA